MTHTAQFTAAEAAFVLREPVRAVKKALDAGPVRAVLLRRAGTSVRTIEWRDLFYLYTVQALRDDLTTKARSELYDALQRKPIEGHGELRFGRFRIAIGDLIDEMDRRTTDLATLSNAVEFRADGEVLLQGTTIEVHRIAALLDGDASIEQVLGDYPSLSREHVETAEAYAAAYPKAGRPYPRKSVKRSLQSAGLEMLDEAQ